MLQTRKPQANVRSAFSAVVLASLVLAVCCPAAESSGLEGAPHTVLWAWQRAEDLSFINPADVGVAYLACSALLSGKEVKQAWRQQPVRVPQGTLMIPVIRVDCDRKTRPWLSADQAEALSRVVLKAALRQHFSSKRSVVSSAPRPHSGSLPVLDRCDQRCGGGVQIDFDALETERGFYRLVLEKVRQGLPEGMSLSVTALASWCIFDNWIKDLPVDETVPMMFSLGQERSKLLHYFTAGQDFRDSRCYCALGISLEDNQMNQLMIPLAKRRKMPVRVYFFTRTAWTPAKFAAVKSLTGLR